MYPVDRNNYACISDTLKADWRMTYTTATPPKPNALYWGSTGVMFDNPVNAGHDFVISLVLPRGVGSANKFDSVWNFTVGVLCDADASGKAIILEEEDPNSMMLSFDVRDNNFFSIVDPETPKTFMLPKDNPQVTRGSDDGYVFFPASSFSFLSEDWNTIRNLTSDAAIDGALDAAAPATVSALAIYPIIAENLASERLNPSLLRVSVSPSPAIDNVNIVCVDNMNKVELLNMSGKVLKSQKVNGGVASINVQGLSSGMYLVRVSTKDNSITKKVIVK
jgi:hypothetical protein